MAIPSKQPKTTLNKTQPSPKTAGSGSPRSQASLQNPQKNKGNRNKEAVLYFDYDSPVGIWRVALTPGGHAVCGLKLKIGSVLNPLPKQFSSDPLNSISPFDYPVSALLHQKLTAYFQGEKTDFLDIPIYLKSLTSFSKIVYEKLQSIGYGEATTYKSLAEQANNPLASRAVGRVLARNPIGIVIPCHRVLSQSGQLNGYFGHVAESLSVKAALLANEGIIQRNA
ncbi:MAG: methylated-DNA--[protein]-cysteine S-methyltransferase [Cyanobacteria bacterium P01_H01_bin.74]